MSWTSLKGKGKSECCVRAQMEGEIMHDDRLTGASEDVSSHEVLPVLVHAVNLEPPVRSRIADKRSSKQIVRAAIPGWACLVNASVQLPNFPVVGRDESIVVEHFHIA